MPGRHQIQSAIDGIVIASLMLLASACGIAKSEPDWRSADSFAATEVDPVNLRVAGVKIDSILDTDVIIVGKLRKTGGTPVLDLGTGRQVKREGLEGADEVGCVNLLIDGGASNFDGEEWDTVYEFLGRFILFDYVDPWLDGYASFRYKGIPLTPTCQRPIPGTKSAYFLVEAFRKSRKSE